MYVYVYIYIYIYIYIHMYREIVQLSAVPRGFRQSAETSVINKHKHANNLINKQTNKTHEHHHVEPRTRSRQTLWEYMGVSTLLV